MRALPLVHGSRWRDCVDDVELGRCGSTQAVPGYGVTAASTVGTCSAPLSSAMSASWIRSAVRCLPGSGRGAPARWRAVDLDSTICAVCDIHKEGAYYGYTRRLGYRWLLATSAEAPAWSASSALRRQASSAARSVSMSSSPRPLPKRASIRCSSGSAWSSAASLAGTR
jgi:hypothetical protein